MNRIHMTGHTNTRRTGRKFAWLLAVILLLGCMMVPDIEAKADSLSLRVSASSVKIGDTVTVSITVPAGVSATVNLTYPSNLFSFSSASETANNNGGTVSMTLGGYGGTNTATTGTVKFKAKAAGSATFSATAPVAGNQEGDQVSIGGSSASVSVRNETNENNSGSSGNHGNSQGGDNSGDDEPDDESPKSADNSLASLTLSKGKLSPEFKYNVVNYTAKVDNEVTSVVVSAKVSNSKATIESVTGGESLVVGDNRIQIVVKAENGVTATYTITVTRAAEGESVDEQQEEEPDPEPDVSEQCYTVNGVKRYLMESLPEGEVPEGFEHAELTLWEQTVPCLKDTFAGGSLYLVYLVDEEGGDGRYFLVLNTSLYEAYDYVRLSAENSYIIILPDGDGNAPAGYAMGTYNLAGKGRIDAWFSGDEREFALVYGVNGQGVRGWYQLDLAEMTYMRYTVATVAGQQPEEPTQQPQEPVANTSKPDTNQLQKQNRLIIGISAIIVLVLLIIIILMAVHKKHPWDDADESVFDDEQEFGEPEENSEGESIRRRYQSSVFAKDAQIEMPEMEMSEMEVSEMEMSEIETPEMETPEMENSNMKIPEVQISETEVSEEDKPEKKTPEKKNSQTEVSEVEIPETEVPGKKKPEMKIPKIKMQEANIPETEKSGLEETADTNDRYDEAEIEQMEKYLERELAADLSTIADPEPMQSIRTYRDEDDDDLEFIDL